VNPVEYVFSIDVFTPTTLPMGRLAQYLAELAKLIGHQEHTHFLRVELGSAQLVHTVEAVDAPKVETRLNGVRAGDAPKDALNAQRALEDLLANDNAVATLVEIATGRVVVPFQGRNRPKPVAFPPFRENATIDGQIVNIGGRDASAHATLQDGDTFHTGISMDRELARQLAPLLYGMIIRLHGSGRFERIPGGVWKMTEFRVEGWEKLDPKPLSDVLTGLRNVDDNGLMDHDAYHSIAAMQHGGDEHP
jgi:hypothetical protein